MRSLHIVSALVIVVALLGLSGRKASAAEFATDYWTNLASMPTARFSFATATGPDGTMYVVGGAYTDYANCGNQIPCPIVVVNTLEAYNPYDGAWTELAPMPTPRWELAATFGADGLLYAIGGTSAGGWALDYVEAYNPSSNTWTECSTDDGDCNAANKVLAPMPTARTALAAVTTSDGTIYALGGNTNPGNYTPTAVVETYKTGSGGTNTWGNGPSLTSPRSDFGATVGPDGNIWVLGGEGTGDFSPGLVEEYVFADSAWESNPHFNLPTAAVDPAVTTGGDGRIYVIGGCCDDYGNPLSTVDALDPNVGLWTAQTPFGEIESAGAATGPDGSVYAIGGDDCGGDCRNQTNIVEVHHVTPGAWAPALSMPSHRADFGAALGNDGTLYTVGGYDPAFPSDLSSAIESYRPDGGTWNCSTGDPHCPANAEGLTPLPTPRENLAAATTTANNLVYAIGGYGTLNGDGETALGTVEAFDPVYRRWYCSSDVPATAGCSVYTLPPLNTPRWGLATTTGLDGTMYAVGGTDAGGHLSGVLEAYNPKTDNAWNVKAPMPTPRNEPAAVTGADGTIYVIGGFISTGSCSACGIATVEAYHPGTNTWTCSVGDTNCTTAQQVLAPMPTARGSLAAAVGPSGDIYVMGGLSAYPGAPVGTVEVYHAGTNSWSTRPSLPTPTFAASAVSDGNGGIEVIGGWDATGQNLIGTIQVYHPSVSHWSCSALQSSSLCIPASQYVPAMPTSRSFMGVTTGPGGTVYALGGSNSTGTALRTVETYRYGAGWTSSDSGGSCASTTLACLPVGNARSHLGAATARCPGSVSAWCVYAIGGKDANGSPTTTALAYNPTGNAWTAAAVMPTARYDLAVVTGANGLIYAIGGTVDGTHAMATVEAYNPATNTWDCSSDVPNPTNGCSGYDLPPLATAVMGLAAAVGPDGTIYAVDGTDSTGTPQSLLQAYRPAGGVSWGVLSAAEPYARSAPTAAAGPDGNIYVMGGCCDSQNNPIATVDVYHPRTNTWGIGDPLPDAVAGMAATAVPDGTIYIVGSDDIHGATLAYAVRANTWSPAAPLPSPASGLPLATGQDGTIYAVDGGNTGKLAAYNPFMDTWAVRSSIPTPRSSLAAATGPDGLIYTFGGALGSISGMVEAYNPATNAWLCSQGDTAAGCAASPHIPPMPTPRSLLAASTAPCPNSLVGSCVYTVGGRTSAGDSAIVEAYDPTTSSWYCSQGDGSCPAAAQVLLPLPSPSSGLAVATAACAGAPSSTCLYAFGGTGSNSGGVAGSLAASYNPAGPVWTALPNLPTARQDIAATVGPDGNVYTFGTTPPDPNPSDPQFMPMELVEAYHPAANTWYCSITDPHGSACAWDSLAPMPSARQAVGVATGQDGTIYVAGGNNPLGVFNTVERYAVPNVAWGTVALSLSTGWNFIDVPVGLMSATAASVVANMNATGQLGSGGALALTAYVNDQFHMYVPGYSPDYPLPPGQGAFVLTSRTGTWLASGTTYTQGQPITLHPGWNAVGTGFPSTGLDGSTINAEIGSGTPGSGCGLQEVATYNGTYQVHLPTDNMYHVPATAGMWILCTQSFAWVPS